LLVFVPRQLELRGPRGGRKLTDPIDREVGQARQDRTQIVADRDFKSSAGFDHRENRGNARPGLLASDVDPIAAFMQIFANAIMNSRELGKVQIEAA
jgi:hypothetical protein